jgi:uncharacterized protein involved in cysteine biosynthesis
LFSPHGFRNTTYNSVDTSFISIFSLGALRVVVSDIRVDLDALREKFKDFVSWLIGRCHVWRLVIIGSLVLCHLEIGAVGHFLGV